MDRKRNDRKYARNVEIILNAEDIRVKQKQKPKKTLSHTRMKLRKQIINLTCSRNDELHPWDWKPVQSRIHPTK